MTHDIQTEIVKVLKNYPGITSHLALSKNSVLVVDLAKLLTQQQTALLDRVDTEVIGQNIEAVYTDEPGDARDIGWDDGQNDLRDEQRTKLATIRKEIEG